MSAEAVMPLRNRIVNSPFVKTILLNDYNQARFAANFLAKIVRTKLAAGQPATFATPGCGSPVGMYQMMFVLHGQLFYNLLTGKEGAGDCQMFMIDGVSKWPLDDRINFSYYLHQFFLRHFHLPAPPSVSDQ